MSNLQESFEQVKIDTHLQYQSKGLTQEDLDDDPMIVFKHWFDHASQSGQVKEPEAVCLSTSTPDGKVSSRYVLLKRFDQNGFVIFTNYESRKSKEIESNPRASLCFYWKEFNQQIRICGQTEKIDRFESFEYFNNRPIGSKLGAWSSPQSKPIKDRNQLLDLIQLKEKELGIEPGSIDRIEQTLNDKNVKVPLPDHWGGIRIIPDEIEFWMGRPNRLHDRFAYTRSLSSHDNNLHSTEWERKRLAP